VTTTVSTPSQVRAGSARGMARAGQLHSLGVLILLAGAFLPIMDFFITNVALPSMDASLHASAASLELVVAGYGVAYASLLVLGGRLGDRLGRTGCSWVRWRALSSPRWPAGWRRMSAC
jgi:MFS family permease